MFRGNVPCTIERIQAGFDVYGQASGYDASVAAQCIILRNRVSSERTSVRFDSSASRGNADELVGDLRIGLAETVKLHDKVTVYGIEFEVSSPPMGVPGRNGCATYSEIVLSPRTTK